MNKLKLTVICGTGVLTLVAGFGARPASALPNVLPLTRLSAPVLDHNGNFWRDRWQGSHDQDRRGDRDDQQKDRDDHRRDRDDSNRNRDRDDHRGNRDNRGRDDRH